MTERLFLRLDGDPLYPPETDVPAGTMHGFAVQGPLLDHVSHIATYREQIAPGRDLVERVLPDGSVHLIFHLGDAPADAGGAGWPALAAGATAAPTVVRLRGRVEGLTVTLRPGAAADLLGVPAGEISGSSAALQDLWRGEARELIERLAGAPDDATRVALLQAALQRRLRERDAEAPRQAMRAARLIAESGGQRPLREVAEAVGIGERRLQQLFHAQVGLSPRAWSRLARLHALLRQLRRHAAPRWSQLALDTGYYDQSHLVNEFRSLCGLTPRRFLERAVSGSSKTEG